MIISENSYIMTDDDMITYRPRGACGGGGGGDGGGDGDGERWRGRRRGL